MTGTLQGYPHTRVNGAAKCHVMQRHGLGHIIVRLCRPAKCVCYDLGVGTGTRGWSWIGCGSAVASAILRKYPRAESGSVVRPVASEIGSPKIQNAKRRTKPGGTRA